MPDYTVFTRRPNSPSQYHLVVGAHAWFNALLPRRYRAPRPRVLSGHKAVTRSLLNGLDQLGIDYRYRPRLRPFGSKYTIVLEGVDPLTRAIDAKRRGQETILAAGPIFAANDPAVAQLLLDPLVDLVLAASESSRRTVIGTLKCRHSKVRAWSSGVDTDYWCPQDEQRECIVIYLKRADHDLVRTAPTHLVGVPVQWITYGTYKPARYRHLLSRAHAMIVLGQGETQGLAMAEAWSMDVPTFVYTDNRDYSLNRWNGQEITESPLLNPRTGQPWSTETELNDLLDGVVSGRASAQYAPRAWTVQNLSDKIAAQKLLSLLSQVRSGAIAPA